MVSFNQAVLVLLTVCVRAAISDDKVTVGYYAESLCPDCLELSNGPLTDAFEKVGLASTHL